jgi:ABC-2 type transport system permease protein
VTGAVYDLGYRPYDGRRGGRRASRAALFRASVRRALGWRRPWRQKVAPFTLLAIAVVPAIVNVGVRYLTRDTVASDIEFITYREYVGVSNALLVFVALTAPDIVCPDRRQRVLPLIFARPLTGVDYVLAKVGALMAILFAFSFLPQVLLFVGQMLVTNDGALAYARHNAEVMGQVPAAVGLTSLYYSVIGVAVASLASRRIIAGASIVGLFLVTSIVAAVLIGPQVTETRFEPGPATTMVDGEAPPTFGSGDMPQTTDTYIIRRSEPTAAPLINLLSLPLILRDLVFIGQVDPSHPMSGLENGGLYAVLVYLLVVAAAAATLLYRYREVER